MRARSPSAVTMLAIGQPARGSGIRTVFCGERMCAVSAMKWTPQKRMTLCGVAAALPRELERVADEVGGVLHLGPLVVVREQHGVALGRQATQLSLLLGIVRRQLLTPPHRRTAPPPAAGELAREGRHVYRLACPPPSDHTSASGTSDERPLPESWVRQGQRGIVRLAHLERAVYRHRACAGQTARCARAEPAARAPGRRRAARAGVSAGLEADDLVEKGRLIVDVLRSGLVDARGGEHGGAGQRRQALARAARR